MTDKRQLPPRVTRSYREFAFYLASMPCACNGPSHCPTCVARMTVARVTHSPDPAIVKRCGRCTIFKRGNDFTPDARYADGLSPWCSACSSEYHKERRRAAHAEA